MFGAEVCDQLGDLLVGERVAEGRHLLAAVEDLAGDFCRGPELVLAQVGEIRTLLAAGSAGSVAVGATLVAKENRAGLLGSFGLRAEEGVGGERGEQDDGRQDGKAFQTRDHGINSRISEVRRASIFRWCELRHPNLLAYIAPAAPWG